MLYIVTFGFVIGLWLSWSASSSLLAAASCLHTWHTSVNYHVYLLSLLLFWLLLLPPLPLSVVIIYSWL